MALEDRGASSTMSSIAFGVTGVLSMIPAIQEIFLDRKLNKAGLEKENGFADNDSFRPDLVARHVWDNDAVFIGCGRSDLEQICQTLEREGVPYIAVDSSMIEDVSQRPPQSCTVIIRDIDGDRAAGVLQEIFAEKDRTGQEQVQEESDLEEEEDLEREIGEEESDTGGEEASEEEEEPQEEPELDEEPDEDQESEEEEDSEKEKKEKKAAEDKKKEKKRRERLKEQRRDENRRRSEALRREEAQRESMAALRRDEDARRSESARRDEESRRAEISRRDEESRRTEASRREEENRRTEDSRHRDREDREYETRETEPRREEDTPHTSSSGVYTEPSSYRDAYAIRAEEIEAQCERFAQAELMRREMERMRLTGEDGSEAYAQLKKQYNSVDTEIKAHHDDFQSVAKGGWRDYATEAVERARNASTEELKNGSWQKPDASRYMVADSEGRYRAYEDRDNRRQEPSYARESSSTQEPVRRREVASQPQRPETHETSTITGTHSSYTEPAKQEHRYSFTSVAAGSMTINQVGNGYTIQSAMSRQDLSPVCGGILASGGASAYGTDSYFRHGSRDHDAFNAIANPVEAAKAGDTPRPGSSYAGFSEATQAVSVAALSGRRRGAEGVLDPTRSDETVYRGKTRYRDDQLQKIDAMNARAVHAVMDMTRNRSFAMMVKMGARTVVQSSVGETEAGSVALSAMYAVQLPAHMVKQQFLNAGRTALDQGDTAMSSLNAHIVRSRAESALGMNQEELAKFASMHNLDLKQLQSAQGDRAAMERLIASHYRGTMRVPGKDDMDGLISALGIRGDLGADGKLGKDEILAFMTHHDETTMAERARALGRAGDSLDGLSDGQRHMVESLFSQGGTLSPDDLKALLTKNGVSAELAEKLAGGNWASNADILAALGQSGITGPAAEALMKELNGVSMEDRAAMIGLYQLHVGDSLDSAGMDEFRNLLNTLNVDQSLKDTLNNDYIHLSHLSLKDIKALRAKYKGNAEAEAFLDRLLNEKVCQILGRNREMSRFELFNGIEGMMFRLAQGTDAMAGANQIMGVTRAITRTTRAGYKLIYNMIFRRMTTPIGIGKLKVTPADLTGKVIKASAIEAIQQTKIAATFTRITNRRVPRAVKNAVGHALHPGKALGGAASKGVSLILQKLGLQVQAKALAAKLTALAASISEALLPVALIIVVVVLVLMMYESIDFSSDSTENYSAAYVSAADGKDAFVQEAVDMLRGYTDDFINEINNAQYNRGMFAGMTGYSTNEDVSAFEAGAYQVVFRGPDGEPIDDISSVDLNNSKDIISMASVFIPTVFTKPGENATEAQKQEYEKDKEHFLDYCTFLWAASHQISIEEYHPGNASNPDADDTSGLQTDAQTGKCQMDYETGDKVAGVNWWIGTGAAPTAGDICATCKKEWYDTSITEHACIEKPAADPCTHGHWEVVSTPIIHAGCKGHYSYRRGHYSCADIRSSLRGWESHPETHKRIWVCDGHMGAVVYATIGRISRMPNFGAAEDYDFDNPESYGGTGIYSYFGGTGGVGSTAFKGIAYSLTDEQLQYLAAMCIQEQSACATNEITMRYQASLMANVYELYGKKKGLSLYDYLRLKPSQGGWFDSHTTAYANANASKITGQCLEWIRDVICNGNRITKANEQGTLETGFVKAVYKGKEYTGKAMRDESIYVSGETILYTSGGQACLFEAFPGGHPKGCGSPVVDPFAIIIN